MSQLEITDLIQSEFADMKRFVIDDAWQQILVKLKAQNYGIEE